MTTIEKEPEKLEGLNDRYLLFNIDNTTYGMPLALALEILTIQSITRLPCVAPYIKGIFNLRGKVIPVLDVRAKLGLPEREYDDKTCIIVVDIHDMHIGLIVDTVSEVITVPAERIIPPPANTASYVSSVSELENSVVLNLDFDAFFSADLDLVRN
ncbi:MAG: chemotaxis protein CheW [Oscillospiraceae bacterium]|jgi:purine-binding chemotaxis protein CheW